MDTRLVTFAGRSLQVSFDSCHSSGSQTAEPAMLQLQPYRRSQGVGQGAMRPRFVAYLVVLYCDRPCPKQNTVARLKSKYSPPILGSQRHWLQLWYDKKHLDFNFTIIEKGYPIVGVVRSWPRIPVSLTTYTRRLPVIVTSVKASVAWPMTFF